MKKIPLILLFSLSLTHFLAGQSRTVTIWNDLNDPVYYLYLAPPGDPEWGEDRLGDEILEPGRSITIEITTGSMDSVFNLMAEDETEKAYRIDGIDLALTDSITITDEDFLPFGGRNPVVRTLTFFNETEEDIYYLYVSSNSSMYWGEDILGDDILYEGETFTIELPIDGDYPQHDILAEGESGSSYEILDENLLELSDFFLSAANMTFSGDDYGDDYYDDEDGYGEDDDLYLDGYRDGFRDAWGEAYKQGYMDAMEEMEYSY